MNGKQWTDEEINLLRDKYADTQTKVIAKLMGRSEKSIYSQAGIMRLKKSEAFLQSELSGRISKLMDKGYEHRFKEGQKVWNKGLKGIQIGGKSTQFRKGNLPPNHKPIGTQRLTKDGYLEIKVTEPNKWKGKHIVEWEKHNGPVPKGSIVVFKSQNKFCTCVNNLEMITRKENMKRNTVHNYPKEIALAVQLRGALNRQINKHLKKLA